MPSMVQRTLIRPPASRLGPVTPQERQQTLAQSPVAGQYDRTVDRDSAFEMLQKKAKESADAAERQAQQQPAPQQADDGGSGWSIPGFGTGGGRSSGRQTVAEAAVKSVVRSVGSQLGRALVRGILGSLTRR